MYLSPMGFPGDTVVENPPINARRHKRHGFDPWVGDFHGQRILADYSPGGRKELDMSEYKHTPTHTSVSCRLAKQILLKLLL